MAEDPIVYVDYDIYKSRRWGDCTFARASAVSLSRKPLSPDIEATPKTNLPISFALARSSPNMASYWYYGDYLGVTSGRTATQSSIIIFSVRQMANGVASNVIQSVQRLSEKSDDFVEWRK